MGSHRQECNGREAGREQNSSGTSLRARGQPHLLLFLFFVQASYDSDATRLNSKAVACVYRPGHKLKSLPGEALGPRSAQAARGRIETVTYGVHRIVMFAYK